MMQQPAAVAQTPHQEAEQSLTTGGQRRINLVWELTQSCIALMVTGATIYASIALPNGVPDTLANALFLVIGFYYSRTNHENIGGVGNRPNERR